MPVLSFVLAPDAVGKFHDAILCLGRIGESVAIEAQRDKLTLATLNTSKSAYASITLGSDRFFAKYHLFPQQGRPGHRLGGKEGRFSCRVYNRALLSVFKGRSLDVRDKDTAVERCEFTIQEGVRTAECRLIVKMVCRHGVLKTYKLTYESAESLHAVFDNQSASQRWTISSSMLKEFNEHFGPKTEQLDIYPENGRCILTSFTEKIADGKAVLKQPLHTSVAVDLFEFEDFRVDDKLHVAVSVKDFRALVSHADTLGTSISAQYSRPTRPMRLSYNKDGMSCEFTLMTAGESRGGSATPAPLIASEALSGVSRQDSATNSTRAATGGLEKSVSSEQQLQPGTWNSAGTPTNLRQPRPSPPPSRATLSQEGLFFPEPTNHRTLDVYDPENEDEALVGWGASADNESPAMMLSRRVRDRPTPPLINPPGLGYNDDEQRISPTQRVSQVRGIFDDL